MTGATGNDDGFGFDCITSTSAGRAAETSPLPRPRELAARAER